MSDSTHSEAEFKLVTILFADIVGSTSLTGRLGPEKARVVFDRCLRRMSAAVDDYGGTVARLMGDGLLAFFGAPQAHEDDPERAVMAAIRMHESVEAYAADLGELAQIRVGINTGRAILGAVGGESLSEYTAMGNPVVLAQRLEAAASAGETRIGETTARLVEHRFELEPLEPFEAKGFEEPVSAYQVISALVHPESARGIAGLASPVVGRELEQAKLGDIVGELASGRGAIVTMTGEPGIGKSRLLLETKQAHRELPVQWLEGRAYSYSEDQPFSVILDFLAEALELAPDDTPAMLDLKLETTLTPLLGEASETVWPYLASLLGAPVPEQYREILEKLDPEALNSKIVHAIVTLIEAIASKQPLLLAFEDLHWADLSSLSCMRALMMATERAPLLLVFLFRPERDRPCWKLKIKAETDFSHRYTHIALEPLDENSSQDLVNNLLEVADIPDVLRQLIEDKAEGNPFFVEELIRELIERGALSRIDEGWQAIEEVSELEVPDTLEKVVQARLDRLPAPERATLQAASVIGRRFPYRVLEAIAPANGDLSEHLLKLQQSDLVRERAWLPELEYIFKHSVVQEVTYGTLLQEQREELHRKAAELLTKLYPERLEELHGALGRHFAASGDRHQALHHYKRAAKRAGEVFAYDEATRHLQHALGLLDLDSAINDRIRLLEELADARGYIAEQVEAVALYQQAIELWRTLDSGEKWVHVRLLRKVGDAVASMQLIEDRSRFDETAFELLEHARAETDGEPLHAETVRVLLALFKLDTRHVASRMNWEAAADAAQSALAIAEQLDDPELLAAVLEIFESLYFHEGNIKEQVNTSLRRLEIIDGLASADLRSQASALLGAGVALKNAGRFEEAISYLQQAEQRSTEIQATLMQASALGSRIECLFRLDRWDEVLQHEAELQELHRRYGIARAGPICFSISYSASVHALRGELAEAQELREEAYDIMTTAGSGSEDDWVRNQHF